MKVEDKMQNKPESRLAAENGPNRSLDEGLKGPIASKHVSKTINQGDLTSECWMVQMFGTLRCETCEFKDTPECGGKNIRKTGKNEKGLEVPL